MHNLISRRCRKYSQIKLICIYQAISGKQHFEKKINGEIVRMPKMSDTMTEGVVSKWHKKVGDKVKTGDLVADIENDKATMEFESYQEGVLLYRGVEEGKAAPLTECLLYLEKKEKIIQSFWRKKRKSACSSTGTAATPEQKKEEPRKRKSKQKLRKKKQSSRKKK
jgi:pyruvate dehydrogenase E2 component (dihydrolipoamide acetyltransferase)